MPSILATANSPDIEGWLRGLASAGISGGASAIVGGITVTGMDPAHYNFFQAKFYILVGALFTANAIVSISKFLSTQRCLASSRSRRQSKPLSRLRRILPRSSKLSRRRTLSQFSRNLRKRKRHDA